LLLKIAENFDLERIRETEGGIEVLIIRRVLFIYFHLKNVLQFFDVASTDIWGSQSRWICSNCWFRL